MDDERFSVPLYTMAEACRYVGVPPSTFNHWARGYEYPTDRLGPVRQLPMVAVLPAAKGLPIVPFIGLTEAMVLASFRKAGVSMQHIRRAVERLREQTDLTHILASNRFYTDGARILYEYATSADEDLGDLLEVVSGQRVFTEVVRDYLARITYDDLGWAQRLILPVTPRPIVAADPRRSFGQPIFLRGGVRVEDVIDRWKAGEPIGVIADDYDVPADDIEDLIRATYPVAA